MFPPSVQDGVMSELMNMGFDLDMVLAVIGECVSIPRSGDSGTVEEEESEADQKAYLFNMALTLILAQQDAHDVTGSRTYDATSDQSNDALTKPSIFPKVNQEWLSKQVDHAMIKFGVTMDKIKAKQQSTIKQINRMFGESSNSYAEGEKASDSTEPNIQRSTFVISDGSSSNESIASSEPSRSLRVRNILSHRLGLNNQQTSIAKAKAAAGTSAMFVIADDESTTSSTECQTTTKISAVTIEKKVRFDFDGVCHPDTLDDTVKDDSRLILIKNEIGDTSSSDNIDGNGPLAQALEKYQRLCARYDEPCVIEVVSILTATIDAGLSTLERMDLTGVHLNTRNAESIAELFTFNLGLVRLNLAECRLESESLRVILQAVLSAQKSITWLSLANNRGVGLNGLKYVSVFLKKCQTLRFLDLSGVRIDRYSASYLSYALGTGADGSEPESPVEGLRVDNCGINQAILQLLVPGIRSSRLMYLSLRNNRLGPTAGHTLADLFKSNYNPPSGHKPHPARLKLLDLQGTDLSRQGGGLSYISAALPSSYSLRDLNLCNTRITSNILPPLADALRSASNLRALNLSCNSLTEGGVNGIRALVTSLSANKALRHLAIANAGVTPEAAVAIAESLPLNTSLTTLDLRFNPIQLAGVMAIAVAMRLNGSLCSLEILPTLGFSENTDTDMAQLLNDISIYCQRNAEIIAAENERQFLLSPQHATPPEKSMESEGQDLVASKFRSSVEFDELRSSLMAAPEPASVPSPSRTTAGRSMSQDGESFKERELRSEIATALEILALLKEMINAGSEDDEVTRQLYNDAKTSQSKMRTLLSSGGISDEALMCSALELFDRLDAVLGIHDPQFSDSINLVEGRQGQLQTRSNSSPVSKSASGLSASLSGSSLLSKAMTSSLENFTEEASKEMVATLRVEDSERSSPKPTTSAAEAAVSVIRKVLGRGKSTPASSLVPKQNGSRSTSPDPASALKSKSFVASLEEVQRDASVVPRRVIDDVSETHAKFMADLNTEMKEIDDFLNMNELELKPAQSAT